MHIEAERRTQTAKPHKKSARRRGFSLTEALCAMTVLCLALLGTVECLSYALQYTGETRLHAGYFSKAEAAGLAAVAAGNPKAGLHPDVELQESSLVRILDPMSGYELKLNLAVYRAKPEIGKAAFLLRAPSFPVILSKSSS